MPDIQLTLTLPEDLVERAKAVDVSQNTFTEAFMTWLKEEIERRESGQPLISLQIN